GLSERGRGMLAAAGLSHLGSDASRVVLITAHRRESFGRGLASICQAIAALAGRFPDRNFVYPMHPNPQVRDAVRATLAPARHANIHLIEPLDYLPFVLLMSRAELVLTDSGGIQEEAPSLGVPVIVLREKTERSEGLGSGLVRLAGTDRDRIVGDATEALSGQWRAAREPSDVYGGGHAARKILATLLTRNGAHPGS
ncbi:MAG: UDP-N-acetylglucosamine 2-epimerase, partial [Hyphomicrobiales bacterium]|nr:UDP-N-acetylglucosamine 2-epimerase [Hyphomicrobiales bacterium]